MSLIDKLHDKALSTKKKHLRYPLLFVSGIADWVAATYEEMNAYKKTLTSGEDERVEPEKDYLLFYCTHGPPAVMAEVIAFAYALTHHLKVPILLLAADLGVREANILASMGKKFDSESGKAPEMNMTGLIGTARSLGYKLADRLRRDEDEPEIEPEPESEQAVDTRDSVN